MTTDPAPPPGQEQLLSPLRSRLRRFLVDPGSRRFGPGGRVMLAGSPRRLFRLSEAGAAIVDRIGTGRALVDSPARSELVDRLLDAGVLHPYPTAAEGAASVADVTLVVPVRDRAGGLESLLESVLVADDTPVAIVVVDDGSTDPDAVRAVVTAAATADGVAVELVRNEQPRGPAAARNTGLRRVATSLVAMVDSDCRVERGWLAPLLTQFADPRVALVAARGSAAGRCPVWVSAGCWRATRPCGRRSTWAGTVRV
ncbi:MAG: glycosyltransferase [Microthrixaceae bacterium]